MFSLPLLGKLNSKITGPVNWPHLSQMPSLCFPENRANLFNFFFFFFNHSLKTRNEQHRTFTSVGLPELLLKEIDASLFRSVTWQFSFKRERGKKKSWKSSLLLPLLNLQWASMLQQSPYTMTIWNSLFKNKQLKWQNLMSHLLSCGLASIEKTNNVWIV